MGVAVGPPTTVVGVTVGVGVGVDAPRGGLQSATIRLYVPVDIFVELVKPVTRMKYVPAVAMLKQKASEGGGGKPPLSVLSTEMSTVEPSGAITSTTTSVPVPLRSGSPAALMKSDEPAPATTE